LEKEGKRELGDPDTHYRPTAGGKSMAVALPKKDEREESSLLFPQEKGTV
jgi:hypothetical protein